MRLKNLFFFVFIYSSCIWLDNTQAWSYRLFKRYQILNFRLKYLLSSVALDLLSPVGTHSVLRLVAGFRFLSSMHILEGVNLGKICSGAKRFCPSPRYLPPSISGAKVVLKETKSKRIRRHGQNHITDAWSKLICFEPVTFTRAGQYRA